MINLLLSLLMSLALQALSAYVEPANRTVSGCFNQTEKTIYANCTAGHMTHLMNVFYGVSPSGQCEYHEGDCTQPDDTSLPCVGQAVCPINLPSGDLGRKLPTCNLYSTYLQANYKCVKETDTVDICRGIPLHDQRGYIKTPRYPYNYPGSRECTTKIIVDPSQRIELYIIDFDLESAPSDCVDWLEIQGNLKAKTLCGKRRQEKTFNTLQNELTLTFRSNEDGENKGFWLYYKATPPLPETTSTTSYTTAAPPVTPQMPQIPPNSTTVRWWQTAIEVTTRSPNSVHAESRLPVQNQHPAHNIPMEAIVGGVLGTLFFILLVLLLILLIKRRKEREMPQTGPTTGCYMDTCAHPHTSSSSPYIQNDLYGMDIDQPYTKV